MALDAVEKAIIRLLQEDGRITTAEMSRRIDVSEPTVRKKLNQLLSDGTIVVRAISDPVALGFEATAYIGIDVERPDINKVAEVLSSYPFIDNVAVTTGPYDIIIRGCFETLRDLYDFILIELASVEGITDSNSFMVLKDFKSSNLVGVPGVTLPQQDQ